MVDLGTCGGRRIGGIVANIEQFRHWSTPASSVSDYDSPSFSHHSATKKAKNKWPLYANSSQTNSLQSTKVPALESESFGPFHSAHAAEFVAPTQEEKEEYLENLLGTNRVNIENFASVLLSLSDDARMQTDVRRVETWVSRLETRVSEDGMDAAPDSTSQESQTAFVDDYIKPTLQCHCFVIQCWAESVGDDPIVAVRRAETWLEKASRLSSRAPPSQVAPFVTKCYNAFLDTCSRGRSSRQVRRSAPRTHANKAEETLSRMFAEYARNGSVIPNTDSLNYVMRAISHCKKDIHNIANQTGKLLSIMEDSVTDQSKGRGLVIRPNPKSYSIWLSTLAQVARGRAQNAQASRTQYCSRDGIEDIRALEDALEHMLRLFRRGHLGLFEDNVPHNTLLQAWAGISGLLNGIDGPMEAEKVFRDMEKLGYGDIPEAAPDATSYLQVSPARHELFPQIKSTMHSVLVGRRLFELGQSQDPTGLARKPAGG